MVQCLSTEYDRLSNKVIVPRSETVRIMRIFANKVPERQFGKEILSTKGLQEITLPDAFLESDIMGWSFS